jgi:hypothetical protein
VRAARRDTGLKANGAGGHAATHEGEVELEEVIVWDEDAERIDGDQADPSTSTT